MTHGSGFFLETSTFGWALLGGKKLHDNFKDVAIVDEKSHVSYRAAKDKILAMSSSPPPAVFSVAQALSMVRQRRERAAEEEERKRLEEEKQRLDKAREKRRRRRKNQKERKAQLKSTEKVSVPPEPGDELKAHQSPSETLGPDDKVLIDHSPKPLEPKLEPETNYQTVVKPLELNDKPKLDEAPSRSLHRGLIPRALLVKMSKKK